MREKLNLSTGPVDAPAAEAGDQRHHRGGAEVSRPVADDALFQRTEKCLRTDIEVIEMDCASNDRLRPGLCNHLVEEHVTAQRRAH